METIPTLPEALPETATSTKWEKIISVAEKTLLWAFQMFMLVRSVRKP